MSHPVDHEVEPLVTDIPGAARLLHLSPVTIRNWLYRGRMPIPPIRIGDRRMFRIADIRAYVAAGGVWPPPSVDRPEPRRRGPGRPRKEART